MIPNGYPSSGARFPQTRRAEEGSRRIDSLAFAAVAALLAKHLKKALTISLTDIRGLVLPKRMSPRKTEPRKVWRRGEGKYFSDSRENERTNSPKRKYPVLKQRLTR